MMMWHDCEIVVLVCMQRQSVCVVGESERTIYS